MSKSWVIQRTTCRLCDSDKLTLVLPMQPSPIADAFVPLAKKNEPQPLFPLDLYQCQDCAHVQNIDVVNPDLLFRDYIFKTSNSKGLVEHFRQYSQDIVHKYAVPAQSLVVEIGSNDGTLLRFFQEQNMRVIGIDPARDIARQATLSGIETMPDFFTTQIAVEIQKKQGLAKLIVANNVYAHSDHLADMTDAIEQLLDDDGVFVFEVSYLLDIVDKFLFDTVYHEHLSYHSIFSLKRFFQKHGLHFFDIERVGTKGGSLRGFVQKKTGARAEQPIVEKMIQEELSRGLNAPAIFQKYEQDILACKQAVHAFIDKANSNHQRIVGYGASTTVITLLYHFELQDKLEYLIDDNTVKHGMFSPGSHLEVKPSSILYEDKPDIVLVMAWQYADIITAKHCQFMLNGGQFVVPLPHLKVLQSVSKAMA
ncbi:MAG: class I SAM-dependent methyltransferase [Legionellaceae bacterium]|nr:class I SAM-dependent methyltransferase [Legionellaceae bacterium]MBP9774368.1 class I SAM-dependent methyltransferase [Legionellaceae bacterium]